MKFRLYAHVYNNLNTIPFGLQNQSGKCNITMQICNNLTNVLRQLYNKRAQTLKYFSALVNCYRKFASREYTIFQLISHTHQTELCLDYKQRVITIFKSIQSSGDTGVKGSVEKTCFLTYCLLLVIFKPSYSHLLISFILFTLPSASYMNFPLHLHWLPCHF